MAKKIIPSTLPTGSVIDSPAMLGRLVKAKRTALGIRLRDCAALCSIGINTLSRIENGNPNVTLGSVFSVLNGLGVKLTFDAAVDESEKLDDWV